MRLGSIEPTVADGVADRLTLGDTLRLTESEKEAVGVTLGVLVGVYVAVDVTLPELEGLTLTLIVAE